MGAPPSTTKYTPRDTLHHIPAVYPLSIDENRISCHSSRLTSQHPSRALPSNLYHSTALSATFATLRLLPRFASPHLTPPGFRDVCCVRSPSFLALYSTYVTNYPTSIAAMKRLQSEDRRFALFLTKLKQNERCQGLDLTSFLIMPVQRVPRYKMLVKTETEHLGWMDMCE